MNNQFPPNYGDKAGMYFTKKDANGVYRVYRKGSEFHDGRLYFTKANANRQIKSYDGIEWATGQIRMSDGQWWPGIAFIPSEARKSLCK